MNFESKENKFLSGNPTSTFTTGTPKLNTEGLMTLTGTGVIVADILSGVADGDLQDAIEKLSAAALGAISEKTGKLIGEYSTKFIELPASIPSKISKASIDRFNLTKEDAKKIGENTLEIKMSLSDMLDNYEKNAESLFEDLNKQSDEAIKNKKIDEQKGKLKNIINTANEYINTANENIKEILTHVEEGAEWLQLNLNREINRAEKVVKDQLETGYKSAEKSIDTFCQNEGNKIGEKMVAQYNKAIKLAAQEINNAKQKSITKAKITSKASAQKAKLQIYAMLGL